MHRIKEDACTVIDEQMPDITLTELNNYSKDILNVSTNKIDIRVLKFIATYAAWKAIDLCKKLGGKQLRLEFNKLYLEGINSSPKVGMDDLGLTIKWLGEFSLEEAFVRGLIRILLSTSPEEREGLLKKITYAIQGTCASLLDQYIRHLSHRLKQDNHWMPIFLKDWAKDCHDNVFIPKLDRILDAIGRRNLLIPLIEEIKNFEEPRRSIYLRMLARNDPRHFYLPPKERRLSFEECGIEMPMDGAVTDLELIQYLSPVTPFIKALYIIQTRENFINVLRDLLKLPEAKKKLRLRVLLWGLAKLQLDEVKKTFEACDLNFDEIQPLPSEEFDALNRNFRSSLEESVTAYWRLNDLVMKYRNKPYKLRAIVYYYNSYLFFNPNIIPENERCAAFSEHGLNLEDYPKIYFQEWYAKEQQIHEKLDE